ncbi:MAG: filamentous hemagglutinin N-terminal domain-containing protein, partial [Leptolyngbyaceae bacterium]|nr:filamentous hemagglutinin N-terminal domain-containing protein [Leptolyngbyaceae bacterium]
MAQTITGDGSIGTQVTPGPNYVITGGQVQGVTTLLHSFTDFSLLNSTDTAHFDLGNVSYGGAANNVNLVIGRVTGGNLSTINGQITLTGGVSPDLFLINPSGFVFGAGASLNVPGSFVASTAESVFFANGERFGVDGTTPNPLLTITTPLGLQTGGVPSGSTIVNRGNLSVAADLTLVADRLDLQGQLLAGRDLTLTASDTVQIRDTPTTAFQAQAGRHLTIQGNQQIDILALNHPTTPFQSGGDLRLISDGAISGDAHFLSGGSLQFQTLGGDPGDFLSLYDPIIYANGDVVFGNYTGVALKVEATGSIQGGNITITGPDISGAIPVSDPDFAILTTQPAAILRAGVASVPSPNTPFGGGGTSFASGTAAAGLPTGSVVVGSVATANTVGGNGGAIILTATGDIVTGLLDTTAVSFVGNSGQSGAITLAANGNLTVNGGIFTSSLALTGSSSSGGTGAISLSSANGDLTVNGSVTATSLAPGTVGSSAPITLTASNGNLVVTGNVISDNQASSVTATPGSSADIRLSATNGNLSVNAVQANSANITASAGGRAGNTGSITLTTVNGDLSVNAVRSIAIGSTGNAGDITLAATNGNLSVLVDALSVSASFNGTGGNGGNIALSSTQGDLVARGAIQSLAVVLGTGTSGNGGAVTLTSANGNLITQGDVSSVTYSANGNAGNAGAITLSAPQASILGNGNNLNSLAAAPLGTAGNGNDITLTARNQISNVNLLTTSSSAQAGTVLVQGRGDLTVANTNILTSQQVQVTVPAVGPVTLPLATTGQSGDVTVTSAGNLTLLNSAIESDTRTNTSAGTVSLTTPGLLQLNNSTVVSGTSSAGQAGNIDVSAPQLTLTGGSRLAATTALGSTGQGGNITVRASTVNLQDGSAIAVDSLGTGDGGNIDIRSDRLTLANQSSLTAETASAQGGNIALTTRDILLMRNNSLISTTAGTALAGGNGGNITINTSNGFVVAVLSENSDIRANAFTGNGGNINITAQGILGLQFQPTNTPNSDITASSQFGLSGTVTLETPDLDPSSGTIELPADLTDASNQVAAECGTGDDSRFVATGRGGVPPTPEDPISSPIWTDLRDLSDFMDQPATTSPNLAAPSPDQPI